MRRAIVFIRSYFCAVLSCLYLFTVGFLFARNRSLVYRLCSHFGYDYQSPEARIPTIEAIIPTANLSEVVPESVSVQIRDPVSVVGNISLLETIVIAKLVQLHKPSRLFEIGTFDGRTTLNMAANAPREAIVYTLDLPRDQLDSTKLPIVSGDKQYIDKPTSGSRYLGTDYGMKIVQLYGDSATYDLSPFFNEMDFVFIDGSHSYEYVMNDSRLALKLLRDGKGIILWHDYNTPYWEGVTSFSFR